MEAKDFSAVTPEIEALAAKSRENNRIDISLYDKYEVKRGLRDLNGKGVLLHCCTQLCFYALHQVL